MVNQTTLRARGVCSRIPHLPPVYRIYGLSSMYDLNEKTTPFKTLILYHIKGFNPKNQSYKTIEDTRSFTIDGTTIKGYNGGELYASATFTPVGEIKNAALQLGSLRGIAADLYCIRIYNRALSAEEIATNYAIDKRRFL